MSKNDTLKNDFKDFFLKLKREYIKDISRHNHSMKFFMFILICMKIVCLFFIGIVVIPISRAFISLFPEGTFPPVDEEEKRSKSPLKSTKSLSFLGSYLFLLSYSIIVLII